MVCDRPRGLKRAAQDWGLGARWLPVARSWRDRSTMVAWPSPVLGSKRAMLRRSHPTTRVSGYFVLLAAAALGCGTAPKAKTVRAEPCNPAADLHACAADNARLTCDPLSATWLTTGYCPSGTQCTLAPLPAGVTPVGAFAAGCTGASATDAAATADGASPWIGPGTPVSGSASGDTADGDGPVDAPPPADVPSALCGNGLCDPIETAVTCAKDCGPPVCGDNACTPKEDKSSCAWDCLAGAAAGATCMVDKCPGASAACKASAACMRKLAQVWACAKGCAPCLNSCLQQLGTDSVAYAAASCGGQQCL